MLQRRIDWLNEFPGGFKLNGPLTSELAHVSQVWVMWYVRQLQWLMPLQRLLLLLRCVSLSGVLGLSGTVALVYDILSVLTLHVR